MSSPPDEFQLLVEAENRLAKELERKTLLANLQAENLLKKRKLIQAEARLQSLLAESTSVIESTSVTEPTSVTQPTSVTESSGAGISSNILPSQSVAQSSVSFPQVPVLPTLAQLQQSTAGSSTHHQTVGPSAHQFQQTFATTQPTSSSVDLGLIRQNPGVLQEANNRLIELNPWLPGRT